MIAALAEWNSARERDGEPPLQIGIGLNYGPAVIGDVGSEQGLSFTVIGDTVNTASRLQGLTRIFGSPLVVGDAAFAAARSTGASDLGEISARLEPGGEQTLRGRTAPVRIWLWGPAR